MKIGIEIELHSNDYNAKRIAAQEGLNFKTFTTKGGLKVKMSVEYYSSTIEYNFEPKLYSRKYIERVIKFIQGQIKKYNLKLNTYGPAFVGTHIHIFDLKYRKLKNNELLQTTMAYIDNKFHMLEYDSRQRLIMSHQLWGNYVFHNYHDYHRDLSNVTGCHMSYTSMCCSRPKYNPVIVSNRSDKGKPRSAEIRIIPNEFLMTDDLCNLLEKIKKGEYVQTNVPDKLYDWMGRL